MAEQREYDVVVIDGGSTGENVACTRGWAG